MMHAPREVAEIIERSSRAWTQVATSVTAP
jgi:hypothetical protein